RRRKRTSTRKFRTQNARAKQSKRPELSRGKGRKTRKIPRTPKQYFALPEAAQEKWNRVAHVISKMRSEGWSLTKASKEFAVPPRKVVELGKSALRKQKKGTYVARAKDQLLRILVIPSPNGLREVAVLGSENASKIAAYSDAVQKYLRTGDASGLRKFKRQRILDA